MKNYFLLVAASCLLLCSCQNDVSYGHCNADDYVSVFAVESTIGTLTELSFYGTVNGKAANPGSCFYDDPVIYDYRIGSFEDTIINPERTSAGNARKHLKIEGAYIIADCKNDSTDTLFINPSFANSPLYTTCYHENPSKDLSNDETYRHFADIVPADHIIKYVFTIDDDYIEYLRQNQ